MNVKHLAVIMDGNRRWAKQNDVSLLYDDSSAQAVYDTISFCQERGIAHLSVYAFSLENLQNREPALKNRLFDVLFEECTKNREYWVEQNVRVRFIGLRDAFPEHLVPALESLERDTATATGLQFNILFCYGAQQELADACKQIAAKVANGDLAVDAITPETIQEHLWTPHSPPPDLLIRTSGVSRLSNCLLFQAAYSELMFVDYYWPEMNKERLAACIAQFEKVNRNYGA